MLILKVLVNEIGYIVYQELRFSEAFLNKLINLISIKLTPTVRIINNCNHDHQPILIR